ncbi:MAG: PorP/SprF family type IX secretion system membrane protein [Bacteroidia bacterium]
MKYFFILVIVISGKMVVAQDPYFSQYNFSKIFTNPAYAGSDSTFNFNIAKRYQRPAVAGGYNTMAFATDNYFRFLKGGLGATILHENQMNGVYSSTDITVMYAPHFELFTHKMVLKPAIQIGYFRRNWDFEKLYFGDQIDERKGFMYKTIEVQKLEAKTGVDLSTGFVIYTDKFYGGMALHHLTEPDEGEMTTSRIPIKITLNAGINFNIDKIVIITPTILYLRQQDFQLLLPGVTAAYKFINVGFGYSFSNILMMSVGMHNRLFKLSYAFDYARSALTNTEGGSHELQLAWLMHHKRVCKIKTIPIR